MRTISATWTRLATDPRLQRSSQALSVLGSQAYVFGGEVQPRQPVHNQLDVIQLAPGGVPVVVKTLPASANAPTPRSGSDTTSLHDALYMFSGRGGLAMAPIDEKGAIWRYTPRHSHWDLIKPADASAPYPASRSYHAIASDVADTIYIHAGCPEKGRLSDLWSFSVSSQTWAELPSAPGPARGGTSIAVCRGRLYRMNGFDGASEQGGAVDVYCVESRTWSTIPFMPDGTHGPEPRSVSALGAARANGREVLVTLFGERDPSPLGHAGAGRMLADVWAFAIEAECFKVEPRGEVPAARGWFHADVMRNQLGEDAVIVHGGLAEDNSRLEDVWKLQFA